MIDRPIQYCPLCGSFLIERNHSGRIRPACPRCNWIYFPDPKVAVAVLIGKGDQISLVRRKFDPYKGYWTLPSGFVDAGEDPRQAAKRECLEETGLKIGEIRLLDVTFSQEHPRGASILIIYQAEVEGGQLNPGDDAEKAAYFKISDLPPLAFELSKLIITSHF
jgi:ADP-ribose pyrophosphatase YjhB (NUDIX family)